jgi:hypothetical protein
MPFVRQKDLDMLFALAEADKDFSRCERCGAWFMRDEENASTVADVEGCWWSVTFQDQDAATCFGSRRQGDPRLHAPKPPSPPRPSQG